MISDQMLAEALAAENERRLNAYLTELQERPAFPLSGRAEKRLLRALSDLQRSAAGGRVRRPERKKLVRALLIAALLIALLFVAAMAYAPLRNAILRNLGGEVELVFQRDGGNDRLEGKYSYLPDGYSLVPEEKNRVRGILEYQNDDATITIYSMKNGGTFLIDTDGKEAEKIVINGSPGYLIETDTSIHLTWTTGTYCHMISADRTPAITREEVIKIAQSRS